MCKPSAGVTRAVDEYLFAPLVPLGGRGNILIEPDNISVQHVWNNGFREIHIPYKYMRTGSTPKTCTPGASAKGVDQPGGDLRAFALAQPQAALCAAACCADFQVNGTCVGYTYAVAPSEFGSCSKGDNCCFLKSSVSGRAPSRIPGIISGAVVTSGGDDLVSPPSGIRSAVPLGGLSAGAVELRADGSMHEWTIANQNPGGQAKIQEYPEALFGARVADQEARVLQTSPKINAPGVARIRYSGSYPVSRLLFDDDAMQGLSLFALSAYKVGDLPGSSRPAVAFVLTSQNAAETDFMFQLPVNVETDQQRRGTPLPFASQPRLGALASSPGCLQACQKQPSCQSWVFERSTAKCTLQQDAPGSRDDLTNLLPITVPTCRPLHDPRAQHAQLDTLWAHWQPPDSVALTGTAGRSLAPPDALHSLALAHPESRLVWCRNVYQMGVDSGLRFSWSVDQDAGCLILARPGVSPASGGMALCVASDGHVAKWSAGTSDDRDELFARFASNGSVVGPSMGGAYGAVSVSGAQSLVVTMGWYFPFKDHYGQVVGNQYTSYYSSAQVPGQGHMHVHFACTYILM